MKKAMMITLCLLLGILVNTSFAAEVNVFGPKQYVRTNGSPDVYTDTFTGLFTDIVNTGKLVIENGDLDDKHRVTSALVYVNGVQIFQPKDFKQKIYLMETAIDLTESNTLEVEIRSKPGTYLTIRVIQDFDPPTVTIHADPDAIKVNEDSTLTWSSLLADTCDIEPDIGPVAVNGSMTVSPDETTTYTITASGPGGVSTASTTITHINSAPVAEDQAVTTDEDIESPILLTATDLDNDLLVYQIVSYPEHGSLTGEAPNLTYEPDENYYGSDSFTFKANDSLEDSNIATVSLTINPINDPPTAVDDTATTDEDTSVTTGDVLTNDTDVEGDSLTLSDFTQPANGTVAYNGDGTFTYSPNLNFNGSDSFLYTASDGNGGTDTATVTITVNPVNDPPIANDQTITLDEDTSASITLTGSDVDGDTLTYQIVTGPSNGILTGTAPNLTYTPNPNYNGSDSFTFKANDGTVDSNVATISLTINAINDKPVADPQTVTTDEDTSVLIILTGTDIDEDPLTYQVSSGPSNGSLSGTPPNVTYTPNANYNGTDAFTFKVNDGFEDSEPAEVTILVNPVNDPPVANDDTATTDEDIPVTTGNVLTNDTDVDGDTLSISGFTQPANGTVVDNGNGTFTYTPTLDFNGSDSFTYTASDGNSGTDTAAVTITVNPVNDPPVANAGPDQTVFREDTVVLDGSGSSDLDGDTLTYQWSFLSVPPGSTATLSDPSLVNPTFVPDVSGTYEVQLIVNDATVDSDPDTVLITANPRMVVVPDLVGMAQAGAESAIIVSGLTVGTITQQNSDTVPLDQVISQNPAAGTSLEEYSPVDLVVSLGPISGPTEIILTASDAEPYDFFGKSVSINGDSAIVGAPAPMGARPGAAYIFKRDGANWPEQATLTVSGLKELDWFGKSVSIDGDYAIVGAPASWGEGSGAAYIFKRDGDTWSEQAKLIAPDADDGGQFGISVSIDGDYIIVGSIFNDNEGIESGSAYIYKRVGDNWTGPTKLIAPDADDGDQFGISVSTDGNYAVVGARWGDSDSANESGVAYVFKRDENIWNEQAKLFGSDADGGDEFGRAVSISGDYVIVGARWGDSDSANESGVAYIFKRDGDVWSEQAKLAASDPVEYANFGKSVSIDQVYAIVGARWGVSDSGTRSGAAYIFKHDGSNWTEQAKLSASDANEMDHFGGSVSIDKNYVIVGASAEGSDGLGTAYIYRIEGWAPAPEVSVSATPANILPGESSTLTWDSTNADSVTIDQGIGAVDLDGSISVFPSETTSYTVTATGTGGTATDSVTVTVVDTDVPPTVDMGATPLTIAQGNSSTLIWTATNAISVSIDHGIGEVPLSGTIAVYPTETTTYTITATNPAGTDTDSVTIIVIGPDVLPTVNISAAPQTIDQGSSSTLSWTSSNGESAHIDNGIGTVSLNGSTVVSPAHTTTYTITVTNWAGTASAQVKVMVLGTPEPQPEGSFGAQYEDLIPPDAVVEEYDPKRFSLITGLVQAIDGSPVSDVSIAIQTHPEYGTVKTDSEGRFTIPVEGGKTMTVIYEKQGFISAQRKVYVPWNDIAIARTIQMIEEDPISTVIIFDGNPDRVFAHRSTRVTDEAGSRSCTMIFTGDNKAYLVDEDGNDIDELTTISTRATEYTTPESMPAILPPNSAYTYCVDLSVDGAARVRFEKPVITWVDNFLGFPVGESVPLGYYDTVRGLWVPSDSGVVVKLLDTDTDGIVDALDATGDDQPDDLNNNGSFNDEVQGLGDALQYQPGATFWRFAVPHFYSKWDANWAWTFAPGDDAIYPNPEGIPIYDGIKPEGKVCSTSTASYVNHRSRILHDDFPIPGTDMTLHYASNRIYGYKHSITVYVSGDTVPSSLKRIIARLKVAGRTLTQILDPIPNQMTEFEWDGLDHLQRPVVNTTRARVEIGFVYQGKYQSTTRFGYDGGGMITGNRTRQEVTLWWRWSIAIPPTNQDVTKGKGTIAKGWTLSPHHTVSLKEPTLFKGDGTVIKNLNFGYSLRYWGITNIETVAGNGSSGYYGDGGPATQAAFSGINGIDIDSEGNIYIVDRSNSCVRKVDTYGIISTIAGNGTRGSSGDSGPATEAQLFWPRDIALDSSGNLYIADLGENEYNRPDLIRRVDTNGIITTIAGYGSSDEEGIPAVDARLIYLSSVETDNAGNIYVVEDYRIRKIDPSGTIFTIAGTGSSGYYGDGGPAIEAQFNRLESIVIDAEGNLFISDSNNHRIRKIDASGIITTIAGTGISGYSGNGGPAILAQLYNPGGIEIDEFGNLYISDTYNHCIRKVDSSGIIVTIAGHETGSSNDGQPAIRSRLNYPRDVALDPSGRVYITDSGHLRVRTVGAPSPFDFIKTNDGINFVEENGLGHVISSGLHDKTIDLDASIVLRTFQYNQDNKLQSITDRFGYETIIQRDSNGVPEAIISPDGITTTLTIDTNNHLTRITYPDDSYYELEYTPDGLMIGKVEPKGNWFGYAWDCNGRLTDTTDQEGGHWKFSRIAYVNGDILSKVLTGEGNLTSYLDKTESTDAYTSTITDPAGAQTLYFQSADGLSVNKSLPCGMELDITYGVDSLFKFQVIKEMTETTPSSLERTTLRDKIYVDTNANNSHDLIIETVTVNGKTITLENNIIEAQKNITSPEGRTVSMLYYPLNLLTYRVNIPGLFETEYGYDSRGRLESITTNTRETSSTYNAQGFLESITDPEGYTTTYTYDPVGRITLINRPDTTSIGFTYDSNGNMTVLTNPSIIDHEFGYNLVNLNDAYYTPLSGSYSYLYDKDRRLKRTTFPSGDQIDNIYNKTRLMQIQTPEGNIDFTYLCGTKVGSISKGTESIAYGYDGRLVTSETLSGTLNDSLGYTYNIDFNPSSFTYAGGTVSYAYDNDGLLTGAGNFTISRNTGNGLPESVTGGALNLDRTFNGYGEVDSQDFVVSGQNLTSWDLSRDDNGRIIQKTETVNGVTSDYVYTYDRMGRLLTVTKDDVLVEDYQYNLNGTRAYEINTLKGIAGRSLTYSDEDHLLTVDGTSYQYDFDGFLTTRTNGTDVTTYDYSSRGELLSVTLPDGTDIDYIHDPLGRRIAKKVNAVTVEKYLWQGLTRLLAVYDGSDNLLMRFQYADARMPVSMTRSDGTYYLTYDQVGSLRVVADSNGTPVKILDYDSFGDIINDSDPSFEVPFGFAGGLHDRDTGLVRFGYRDYDPDTSRWTAKDPILFNGGDTDLYGYCLNDPVNAVDPLGILAPNWHFGITYAAARHSGMGILDSIKLGWGSVAADFGTQGYEPEQTNLHAMAGRGQIPEEAIKATKKIIDNPCIDKATRVHAAQDLATPGHAGVPWKGFHFDMETAKHILGDFFPSLSTVNQALSNTISVLGSK